MAKLYNRVKVATSTAGTGSLTLGAAVTGFQTLADAGATDGETIRYVLEDGDEWEIGEGLYTASGPTLSRTVLESSNGGAKLNLSGAATVFVTAAAEDFIEDFTPAVMERIKRVELSSDPDVEFTEFDNSRYDDYYFTFSNVVPDTDNVNLQAHTSKDGGINYDTAGSDYSYRAGIIGTSSSNTSSGISALFITNGGSNNVGSAAGEDGVSGFALLSGAGLSKRTFMNAQVTYVASHGGANVVMFGGWRNEADIVDAIRFSFNSGNMESGVITMYGLRKT